MREPLGLTRHHVRCQLGRLNGDDNCCPRKPLLKKHYGLRLCAFHLKRILEIRDAAIKKGTIGKDIRKPRHRPSQRSAA